MHRPVRVCFLIDRLGLAGTETQLVGLVRRLDRAVVSPSLALLDGERDRSRALEPDDCPVLRLGVRSLSRPSTLTAALRLGRFLRREQVDVLQLCSPDSAYLGSFVGRLSGIPRVVYSRRSLGYWMTPLRRRMDRLVLRLADAALTNCAAIRDELEAGGLDPDRVFIVENGIDLAPFEAIPPLAASDDRPSPRRVGVVANLRPVKDLPTFLRACRIVADADPSVSFAIAGEGEEGPALGRLIAELGLGDRVALPGAVRDVPAFLAGLDISVLCSRSEGQSNALIEAMAAGRAVVATAVGGTPELIEDGETGLLVPPGDPDCLASAIVRLLRDRALAARLGAAARLRARRRHGWEAVARRFERLYARLAAGAPARFRPIRATPMLGLAGSRRVNQS